MKKYIITGMICLTALSGCSDEDYENLNVDPINPSEVPAGYLVSNATKSLFDQMVSTSVNRNVFRLFAQYWTETTYTQETNYDIRQRNLPDAHWGIIYRDVLYDLRQAKGLVETDMTLLDGEKANQLAIIEILEVYTWQQLVDTFGDIPYTEALMGTENPAPVYDDAATIYSDLISRLSAAYNDLDTSSSGFDSQDIIYGGNIDAWKKLAASMKLKIAMTLADVNPSQAQSLAIEAVNNGVFTSNSDNFELLYEANNTNANPMFADLYLSGRNDFIPADTFVDYVNELEDPRRPIFFADNLAGDYQGGVYGALNNYILFTNLNSLFKSPDLPGVLFDYSEVEFLLAEAAARGFAVGGTAEEHYNNGITANMEYWGVEAGDIATYLDRPDVAYSTAPGDWKEKIGKQFWIAMYNRGFEGWTVWRRLDAPELRLAAATSSPVPFRFLYPAEEQTLNGTNYNAATSAIGGDDLYTKLFWDVN